MSAANLQRASGVGVGAALAGSTVSLQASGTHEQAARGAEVVGERIQEAPVTSSKRKKWRNMFAVPKYMRQLLRVNASILLFAVTHLVVWGLNFGYRALLQLNNAKYAKSYADWTACAFAHFEGSAPDAWKAVCGEAPAERLPFTSSLMGLWVFCLYGFFMSLTYLMTTRKLKYNCWSRFMWCLDATLFICCGYGENEEQPI
jgi:hypothetical protein